MTREDIIDCMEIAQSAAFVCYLGLRVAGLRDTMWPLLPLFLLLALGLAGVLQAFRWKLSWKDFYVYSSLGSLLVVLVCGSVYLC